MKRIALLTCWLLCFWNLQGSAQARWWSEIKEARAANRKKDYLTAQKLFLQSLQHLEATRAVVLDEERHSLAGLLPDMERSFSRTFRELSPAEQARLGPQHNREKLDRTRRLAEIQRRLLGPKDKATLDTLKHLQFLKAHP